MRTVTVTNTSQRTSIRYRPSGDSWRYLLLLFVLFALSPIVYEAYNTESTLLLFISILGGGFSGYAILNQGATLLSLQMLKNKADPYRNAPAALPVLSVSNQEIKAQPGALLTHFDAEPFQETSANGASVTHYRLLAVYNNQERIELIPYVQTKAEAQSIIHALTQRLS